MRILVIDDDKVVLDTISLMLMSEGHVVLPVTSGRDGLLKLEAGEPVDLVLSDLSMPDLTGWDLLRAIRSRWPALRVGILTEANAGHPADWGRPDLLLNKPIGLADLRAALRTLES